MAGAPDPTLRVERALFRGGARWVAGLDEVGRGSLAGPVSVGAVVVGPDSRPAPRGVRDSKLLSAPARQALVTPLQFWAAAWGVGHASAREIDDLGLMTALRLASWRALADCAQTLGVYPDVVLLDGNVDFVSSPPQQMLFGGDLDAPSPPEGMGVRTQIRADQSCASVAAASVLAKAMRDTLMTDLARVHPEYRWDANMGYASPDHVAAIRAHGVTGEHRTSWKLPAPQGGLT